MGSVQPVDSYVKTSSSSIELLPRKKSAAGLPKTSITLPSYRVRHHLRRASSRSWATVYIAGKTSCTAAPLSSLVGEQAHIHLIIKIISSKINNTICRGSSGPPPSPVTLFISPAGRGRSKRLCWTSQAGRSAALRADRKKGHQGVNLQSVVS